MYHDLSDLSHDPQLATALGNMVAAWANAESILCGVMARITNIPLNMALFGFYRIPTFEARRKVIQALMLEWNPSEWDKAAIAKEVDGISDLSLARNDWIHGVWCANDDKSETVVFDFRRPEGKGRRKAVKGPDVENHVTALRKRTMSLGRLIKFKDMT